MKKGFGLVLLALISAAAGAVLTVFALKKKEEYDEYDYDFDDDDFQDDCEGCDCEECNEEFFDNEEETSIENEDAGLDVFDEFTDEIEDVDGPTKSDF